MDCEQAAGFSGQPDDPDDFPAFTADEINALLCLDDDTSPMETSQGTDDF
jgi:hypothetical protein